MPIAKATKSVRFDTDEIYPLSTNGTSALIALSISISRIKSRV